MLSNMGYVFPRAQCSSDLGDLTEPDMTWGCTIHVRFIILTAPTPVSFVVARASITVLLCECASLVWLLLRCDVPLQRIAENSLRGLGRA